MIKPILRKELFKANVYADNLIAATQQSYATDIDHNFAWERAFYKKYFDHTQPFQPTAYKESYGVMAYPAISKADYAQQLPERLAAFLNALGIGQVYLLDYMKTGLNDFPFENFRQQNQFKLLAGKLPVDAALLLDAKGIEQVLPYFFFSQRYDRPVIFMMSANEKVNFAMNLCDDGNLHLHFEAALQGDVLKAAASAGFRTGDLELCSQYFVQQLR